MLKDVEACHGKPLRVALQYNSLMTTISEKQKVTEFRKKLSIELCENFTKRLNPQEKKEVKIGAIIAIRNLIKESKINDPIIYSFLVDTIIDPDNEVRNWVSKVIKDVKNPEIIELLELKLKENINNEEVRREIRELIKN